MRSPCCGSGYPLQILAALRVFRSYPFRPAGSIRFVHRVAAATSHAITPCFRRQAEYSVLIATQYAAIAFTYALAAAYVSVRLTLPEPTAGRACGCATSTRSGSLRLRALNAPGAYGSLRNRIQTQRAEKKNAGQVEVLVFPPAARLVEWLKPKSTRCRTFLSRRPSQDKTPQLARQCCACVAAAPQQLTMTTPKQNDNAKTA